MEKQKQTNIAYRCPKCGDTVFGLVGQFALKANLVRLKCPCGGSNMDVAIERDGKMRLSIPCLFCKTNHTYTVSQSLFFERDLFMLGCPYSNMDIGFLGEEDEIKVELERTGHEINELLKNLEVDDIKDIQPQDMNDEEILPDPEVYDIVRFLVSELKEDGKIDCPCHSGEYDFRFTDHGVEVVCTACGASYVFPADSVAVAREYLDVDEVKLK